MSEITVTNENFDTQIINSKTPVLAEFGAGWCKNCAALSPILTDIAEEYREKIKILKIDVDSEPELSARFSVKSIPSLLLFENGIVTDKSVGFKLKKDIVKMFVK